MPLSNATADFRFLGGAGTVTGSKYLLRLGQQRLLVDCGLFQGLKELRLRNWAAPEFDPRTLDAIVLSHAHIDHIGCLPLVVRRGYRGPVYCTPATKSLAKILLLDAAKIQEEEAYYANRKGFSKHRPALPLFESEDAHQAIQLLEPRPYHESFETITGVSAIFRRTGHILGSASVDLRLDLAKPVRWVFSGDLGRWNRPMLRDPEFVPEADVLLIESTYGDRLHAPGDPSDELAQVVNAAADRGGALIIPAFAVGRTQELIWRLHHLEEAGKIPRLPTYIDSPMADDVTRIFCDHPEDHDVDMQLLTDERRCPLCSESYSFTRTTEQSKELNHHRRPLIIIATNGMATAGRVLHHFKQRLPDPRTTVLLVGYQAQGTRGWRLEQGEPFLRIHGSDVPVRASVVKIDGLSAHGDQKDLLRWFQGFERRPKRVFVVHGEPAAAQALADAISRFDGCQAAPAVHGQTVSLTES